MYVKLFAHRFWNSLSFRLLRVNSQLLWNGFTVQMANLLQVGSVRFLLVSFCVQASCSCASLHHLMFELDFASSDTELIGSIGVGL